MMKVGDENGNIILNIIYGNTILNIIYGNN
jgi:hypothetical protein